MVLRFGPSFPPPGRAGIGAVLALVAASASPLAAQAPAVRLVEAAGVDEPGAHALPDGCVRVALGRGRDRPFALTQIGERCGGANGPRYVARIEGALGGPSVGGRWAVLALRPDVRAADVAIESDCEMVAGSPAWRMVPAPPLDDPPALHLPRRAGFEPCCLADALEFEAFWRRFGEGAPAAGSAIDFEGHLAIVEPEQVGGDGAACWRTPDGLRVILQQGEIAVGDPLRLAVQLVPRVAGKLQLDLEVAGRTGVARRLLQREVLDPATAPLLTVLRYLPFDAMKRGEPLCERATTVHEWRELRARLGGAAAALPDGWCSFHGSAIVAVVANADRVSAGFRFLVAEEEGVDVLTARQVGPSGRFVEQRSFGFVAVVPDRKGQLAVVLRRSFGPGPPTEKTLRVFAPVGR